MAAALGLFEPVPGYEAYTTPCASTATESDHEACRPNNPSQRTGWQPS